jgi:hypothetical protein
MPSGVPACLEGVIAAVHSDLYRRYRAISDRRERGAAPHCLPVGPRRAGPLAREPRALVRSPGLAKVLPRRRLVGGLALAAGGGGKARPGICARRRGGGPVRRRVGRRHQAAMPWSYSATPHQRSTPPAC